MFWFGFPDETDEVRTKRRRVRTEGLDLGAFRHRIGDPKPEKAPPHRSGTPPVKGKEYVARSLDKSVNGLG